MAARHTVTYQNFNESNLILTPITEKSFKAGGISYGNIRYKYKNGDDLFYLMIKDVKLTRNLIDKFRSKADGGYHESEYCDQRYKAIISTKEMPELEKVLESIDNKIKKFGIDKKNNSILEYFESEINKFEYIPILKKPTSQAIMIYRDKNKDAKKLSVDEIRNKLGNKLKLNLKVQGTTDAQNKYHKITGKDANIDCNLYTLEGVELNCSKKNLDFFEKTFTRGCNIDINIKIASWWCSPSQKTYGPKCIVNDIIVNSLAANSNDEEAIFVDDNGEDVFNGVTKLSINDIQTSEDKEIEDEINNVIDNDITEPHKRKIKKQENKEVKKEEIKEDEKEDEIKEDEVEEDNDDSIDEVQNVKPEPKTRTRRKKIIPEDD